MLVEFSITNFRSIAETVTFSMEAAKERDNAITTSAAFAPHLLRIAAIFGANGSGKTNVLLALANVQALVRGDFALRPDPDEGLQAYFSPFIFDKDLRNAPTRFDIVFLAKELHEEETLFNYKISYNFDRIIEEHLIARSAKPRSRDRILFERVWSETEQKYEYNFGSSVEGPKDKFVPDANETLPLLTVLGKSRAKEFVQAYLWLVRLQIITNVRRPFLRRPVSPVFINSTQRMLRRDDQSAELISSFLSHLDVRVTRIDVREQTSDAYTRTEVQLVSPDRSGEEVGLPLEAESEGTRKLFELAGAWILALRSGATIFVDELQNGLHPKALLALIELFKSPIVNPHNAQLVITSHDVTLLRCLRRDEVWFADKKKDGATELYSLLEYKTHAREDSAFDRQYLEGRYGGIPIIDDVSEFANLLHGRRKHGQRELF
jgi:uncharacterized protein